MIFNDVYTLDFLVCSLGLHFVALSTSVFLRPCLRPKQLEVDSKYKFSVEIAKFLREGTRPYKDRAAVDDFKNPCLERRQSVCGLDRHGWKVPQINTNHRFRKSWAPQNGRLSWLNNSAWHHCRSHVNQLLQSQQPHKDGRCRFERRQLDGREVLWATPNTLDFQEAQDGYLGSDRLFWFLLGLNIRCNGCEICLNSVG